MNIVLSVCIPTYNRKKELLELVQSVLISDYRNFEIVITDNVSSDGTIEELNKVSDKRLRVVQNKEPIPPLNNMIQAVFNAKGKYALYCNDRDLLFPDSINELIDLLSCENYSFVYTKKKNRNNTHTCQVFEKGFESLINMRFTYHPTGMVFNCELMNRYLNKDTYFAYLHVQHTYCFLMRDLFVYEKSAVLDNGCWDERQRSYLAINHSKTRTDKMPFFFPEVKILLAKETLEQVINTDKFNFSDLQKEWVALQLLEYYGNSIITYKQNMASFYMTSHYGLKRKFVNTFQILKEVQKYCCKCNDYMINQKYSASIVRSWRKYRLRVYFYTFITSLKVDVNIIRQFVLLEQY